MISRPWKTRWSSAETAAAISVYARRHRIARRTFASRGFVAFGQSGSDVVFACSGFVKQAGDVEERP